MTTHPGHIPVNQLARLLNDNGHKRADFITDLHKLVATHAITTVNIATGTTAYHPRHGHITIISAHPTPTGHATIAVPHARGDDGVEIHTVYAHELTPDRPPLPPKLTTRQHYRDAPIGTSVTVVAGDNRGVTYTKNVFDHWTAGHKHAYQTDGDMEQFLTILNTPDTDQ